jgi:hypothetical protein
VIAHTVDTTRMVLVFWRWRSFELAWFDIAPDTQHVHKVPMLTSNALRLGESMALHPPIMHTMWHSRLVASSVRWHPSAFYAADLPSQWYRRCESNHSTRREVLRCVILQELVLTNLVPGSASGVHYWDFPHRLPLKALMLPQRTGCRTRTPVFAK